MKSIGVVIPSFYPAFFYGGPIFSSLAMCKELSELGCTISVQTTDAGGKSAMKGYSNLETEVHPNVSVFYHHEELTNRFSLSLLRSLEDKLQSVDLIQVQSIFSYPTPVALRVASRLKKPVILTPRGQLGPECLEMGHSKFKRLWLEYLIRPFAHNICWHSTSEQESNEILEQFPNAKILMVPNGIDEEEYRKVYALCKSELFQRYDLDFDPGSPLLVSMSRIHKKKGFDILLKSFCEVLKKYPDATLLIAGPDHGHLEELQALKRKLKLDRNMQFLPPVQDREKLEFLGTADLFVLPSHNENFGIVYAESMAMETPVIASLKTPWSEINEINCGKWVENSVEATTKAIFEMLESDLIDMGHRARKFILENYTWKGVGKKFQEGIYKICTNDFESLMLSQGGCVSSGKDASCS